MTGISSPVDLAELAEQLTELRERLEASTQTPESRIALEEVQHAVAAAKSGNGPAVMSRLKKAGKVAYDVAVAFGSGVLIEVIKKANGM